MLLETPVKSPGSLGHQCFCSICYKSVSFHNHFPFRSDNFLDKLNRTQKSATVKIIVVLWRIRFKNYQMEERGIGRCRKAEVGEGIHISPPGSQQGAPLFHIVNVFANLEAPWPSLFKCFYWGLVTQVWLIIGHMIEFNL